LTEGRTHRLVSQMMFSRDKTSLSGQNTVYAQKDREIRKPLVDFYEDIKEETGSVNTNWKGNTFEQNYESAAGKAILKGIGAAANTIVNGVARIGSLTWEALTLPFRDKNIEKNDVTDYVRYADDNDNVVYDAYRGGTLSLDKAKLDQYRK